MALAPKILDAFLGPGHRVFGHVFDGGIGGSGPFFPRGLYPTPPWQSGGLWGITPSKRGAGMQGFFSTERIIAEGRYGVLWVSNWAE